MTPEMLISLGPLVLGFIVTWAQIYATLRELRRGQSRISEQLRLHRHMKDGSVIVPVVPSNGSSACG